MDFFLQPGCKGMMELETEKNKSMMNLNQTNV